MYFKSKKQLIAYFWASVLFTTGVSGAFVWSFSTAPSKEEAIEKSFEQDICDHLLCLNLEVLDVTILPWETTASVRITEAYNSDPEISIVHYDVIVDRNKKFEGYRYVFGNGKIYLVVASTIRDAIKNRYTAAPDKIVLVQ